MHINSIKLLHASTINQQHYGDFNIKKYMLICP